MKEHIYPRSSNSPESAGQSAISQIKVKEEKAKRTHQECNSLTLNINVTVLVNGIMHSIIQLKIAFCFFTKKEKKKKQHPLVTEKQQ